MTITLHLTNGDCTLHLLQQSGLPGAMFSGDDILMEGPTPNGLRDEADWELRAEYLADHFNIPAELYRQRVAERERHLQKCSGYDEVVLWFEEDLFCQANLLFLLDWFVRQELGATQLTLVCPADERLGMLSPQQLAQLFETREVVTPEKLQFARTAWAAYCAPEPTAIEDFLQGDFSMWPMLKVGLQNHLKRLPSTRNGLNFIEQEIVAQLATTTLSFVQLFQRVTGSTTAAQLGLGDMQLATYVAELAAGDEPLVSIENFGGLPLPGDSGEAFRQWNITLTDAGREVAAGKHDWLRLTPLNRWLGGTHLTPGNVWRWDEEQEKLVRA